MALLQLLTDQRKVQILHPHPSQQGGRGEGVGPGHLPLRMGPTKCAHHSHVDPVGQKLVRLLAHVFILGNRVPYY